MYMWNAVESWKSNDLIFWIQSVYIYIFFHLLVCWASFMFMMYIKQCFHIRRAGTTSNCDKQMMWDNWHLCDHTTSQSRRQLTSLFLRFGCGMIQYVSRCTICTRTVCINNMYIKHYISLKWSLDWPWTSMVLEHSYHFVLHVNFKIWSLNLICIDLHSKFKITMMSCPTSSGDKGAISLDYVYNPLFSIMSSSSPKKTQNILLEIQSVNLSTCDQTVKPRWWKLKCEFTVSCYLHA